ncbi:N-acetylglucosaminyl-phosphatidylinositol de-N-acetylase [Phytophthora boehmeriae]|uniref:N-acetylglucosaminyl-phosphatidylinositol de-N-acetylase n=1 Tax=Phytophthora boehmeriae TaxID=109152 RepID=A0A8T1WM05_9STRA|nr:N-acetylglucosaminyl-phosphatidylinositol de-N-acetylase [Phytophthora boehmeriae]
MLDLELQTVLEMLKYLLLGTNVFLFFTAALIFFTSSVSETSSSRKPEFKRALLVTAHPDDESMFFLPLVNSLQQQNTGDYGEIWQIHLLCLSRGNYDGLGDLREKELLACATYLGLSSDHVQILEDPKLQDGMKTQWDIPHIATIVAAYMDKHNIDTVFTFDDYGVSGHANHIATHFGVKRALQKLQERCNAADSDEKVVTGWGLESTSLVRKYVGILDTALSYWQSGRDNKQDERQFVFVFRPRWNYNAMAMHQSQFVWYRRLFVAFSRYTFINTFRPLLPIARISTDEKKKQ